MKAVMYHYVREHDDKHPNFRFLDIVNFRLQLDYFSDLYGFVSQEDWRSFVNGNGIGNSEGKVILTFDDALSCHFDYVFPELERRGLWGIFYVPTSPYTEGKLLDVHRIHLLCGAFDGKELHEALLTLITQDMVPDNKREEFRKMTYTRQSNYEGVSEFKRILNYFVDYAFRENLIEQITSKFNYNFDRKSFYVSPKNLLKMKKAGHVIGSHTVDHPVMSKLSRTEQLNQIKPSFEFLEGINCVDERTYCHPYGGFHSFNDDTVELLTSSDIKYSFNVESRDIDANDIKNSRQFLPRYDCNEFLHGKAS